MFIDQVIRAISATVNFHKRDRLAVIPMPKWLVPWLVILGVVVVMFFGTWWGLKFKRIYLDAWPTDKKLNTVFMRMTASDAKPFYALKFIKENKLKGKMFNYWTEGGFIAWGQEPDPNTGKTGLQLFMDGRAQAAYEPRAYNVWQRIMFGGPIVERARAKGRMNKLSKREYKKIGEWVSGQLRKFDVWLVLMPVNQFDSKMVRGLVYNADWPVVFLNNKQKIFVDRKTEKGQKLFEGIFNGQTVYPNEFSKNLILAHSLLLYDFGQGKSSKRRGLDFAIKAFKAEPSQAPIQEILFAYRQAELRPSIDEFCASFLKDSIENKAALTKEDGYYHKNVVAFIISSHLQRVAKVEKNEKLEKFYADKAAEFNAERRKPRSRKRW